MYRNVFDTELESELVSLKTQDGARIHGTLVWRGDTRPTTGVLSMHPASHGFRHFSIEGLSEVGLAGLRLRSRFAGNDSTLTMEEVMLDIAAGVKFLREWGCNRVVLFGHSGGGPLMSFYQSQAESPTVKATPAGDPPDLTAAELPPADAIITSGAHLGRHRSLAERIDPSVVHESDPFGVDADLDMFDPKNGPPYSNEFLSRYRNAQAGRIEKITDWAKEELEGLRKRNHPVTRDFPFIVWRTEADPLYLDLSIEPNLRSRGNNRGDDAFALNYAPKAQGRFTSLRSWLSQWGSSTSNADTLRHIARVSVPLLITQGTADRSPISRAKKIFEAAGTKDKSLYWAEGATHYYRGQKEILLKTCQHIFAWLRARGM
ncbi:MAG TPA: alpha/beta hydrolase [Candidatus Binatia bacterium]|jgi:pimeloyl-ACP methyl ester carboxylesterase